MHRRRFLRAGTRARGQQRRYRRPWPVDDGAAEGASRRGWMQDLGRAIADVWAMGVHSGNKGGRRTCQRGVKASWSPGRGRRVEITLVAESVVRSRGLCGPHGASFVQSSRGTPVDRLSFASRAQVDDLTTLRQPQSSTLFDSNHPLLHLVFPCYMLPRLQQGHVPALRVWQQLA